jgi:hypothetical protein
MFCLLLAFAFSLYFNRKKGVSLKQNFDQQKSAVAAPALRVVGMQLTKFQGTVIKTSIVAGEARLKEPNQIILSNGVEAIRFRGEGKEIVRSLAAAAHFKAKNVNELLQAAKLQSAEARDRVQISVNNLELQSEFVEFSGDTQALNSKMPVLLLGRGKKITGSDGFYLDVDRQEMELFGDINGELQINEKNKSF